MRTIFISYDTREYEIASWFAQVLEARVGARARAFVAKHDIRPGDDPLEVMLRENLLKADALIAICSPRSKTSPWLWWESASVWARGRPVLPVFFDIAPGEFGAPIATVCQGRDITVRAEVDSVIASAAAQVVGQSVAPLSDKEWNELEALLSRLGGGKLDELLALLRTKGPTAGYKLALLAAELGWKPSEVREGLKALERAGHIAIGVLNSQEVVCDVAPQYDE